MPGTTSEVTEQFARQPVAETSRQEPTPAQESERHQADLERQRQDVLQRIGLTEEAARLDRAARQEGRNSVPVRFNSEGAIIAGDPALPPFEPRTVSLIQLSQASGTRRRSFTITNHDGTPRQCKFCHAPVWYCETTERIFDPGGEVLHVTHCEKAKAYWHQLAMERAEARRQEIAACRRRDAGDRWQGYRSPKSIARVLNMNPIEDEDPFDEDINDFVELSKNIDPYEEETVVLEVGRVLKECRHSWRLEIDGEEFSIPKSMLRYSKEMAVGDEGTEIEILERYAAGKGLI